MLGKALLSKSIWLGIFQSVWALVQVFIQDGVWTREAVVGLLVGIAIIILRAVTTKPLAEKESLG